MRIVRPGDTYRDSFTTQDGTGAAAAADSLPTGAAFRNGTADGAVTVTISSAATGAYVLSFTVPGGYAPGDVVQALVTAVIGGLTVRGWSSPVTLSGWPATALPNAAAGASGGVAVIGAAPLTYLDAAVGSRAMPGDAMALTTLAEGALVEQTALVLADEHGAGSWEDGGGSVVVASDGLDDVLVAGKTLPDAIRIIGAAVAGPLSGSQTDAEAFADFAGQPSHTVTADEDGNRTSVLYA